MKYRIVKHYGEFAIQRKTIFGWLYLREIEELFPLPIILFPKIIYPTLDSAEIYVKQKVETGEVVKEF